MRVGLACLNMELCSRGIIPDHNEPVKRMFVKSWPTTTRRYAMVAQRSVQIEVRRGQNHEGRTPNSAYDAAPQLHMPFGHPPAIELIMRSFHILFGCVLNDRSFGVFLNPQINTHNLAVFRCEGPELVGGDVVWQMSHNQLIAFEDSPKKTSPEEFFFFIQPIIYVPCEILQFACFTSLKIRCPPASNNILGKYAQRSNRILVCL